MNAYQKTLGTNLEVLKAKLKLTCELTSSSFGEPQLIIPGVPGFSATLNFDGGVTVNMPSPLLTAGERKAAEILLRETEQLVMFLE